MSIINGYDKPRFSIFDVNDNFIEYIDLDFTNSEGLIEDYQTEDIFHQILKNNEIIKKNRAKVRITFTLNYNQHLESATALKIQSIKNYEDLGFKVFITPRRDVPQRRFQVVLTSDTFSLGVNKGGEHARSNKLLVMKWVTKKLESQNWINTDNQQFMLMDFILI